MKIYQKHKLLFIGVGLGVTYGLIARLFFGEETTLASVSFLFVIPTVLGIIPFFFIDDVKIKSDRKISLYRDHIFVPWLTFGSFFLIILISGLEDFACLLILAGPFIILGTLGALIFRFVRISREKTKNKLLTISILLLLPFALSYLEEMIESPSDIYVVESQIAINSTREIIWDEIVEVQEIKEEEYNRGFFNFIGIPRPMSATVNKKEIGGKRIGKFEGGLMFVEDITEYDNLKQISFDIRVDPNSVRTKVFDQHVLNGNYFRFVNAKYELEEIESGGILLKLSSNYQMTSKVNFYGKFWGDIILNDFQERLLTVIKNRCE